MGQQPEPGSRAYMSVPKWMPVSVISGGAAANNLVENLDTEWGRKLYAKLLIRQLANGVYKVCHTMQLLCLTMLAGRAVFFLIKAGATSFREPSESAMDSVLTLIIQQDGRISLKPVLVPARAALMVCLFFWLHDNELCKQ